MAAKLLSFSVAALTGAYCLVAGVGWVVAAQPVAAQDPHRLGFWHGTGTWDSRRSYW